MIGISCCIIYAVQLIQTLRRWSTSCVFIKYRNQQKGGKLVGAYLSHQLVVTSHCIHSTFL